MVVGIEAGLDGFDRALLAHGVELDPPSEAIKSENVGGREALGEKRGHHDRRVRGGERDCGNQMAPAFAPVGSPTVARPRPLARHFWTAPSRRASGLPHPASNEDRTGEQVRRPTPAELGEKIDWLALGVEPTGVSPAGPDQHVGGLLKHEGDAVEAQIGANGDADLAFDHRDPVERLAPMLIGQRALTEALDAEDRWSL